MNILDRLFGKEEDLGPVSGKTYLIAGLGNPGREYVHNRHNIGFMAIDAIAGHFNLTLNRSKNRAIIGDTRYGDNKILLAKPQTFMNSSGDSIGPLCKFYKIPNDQVVIIYDELDLEFGTFRIRKKGSAGGHNGMRSIIYHIGDEFPRIRLGIGRPPGKMPVKAYVLQDFGRKEIETVEQMLERTVQAIETMIKQDIELAMSRYNGKVTA